MVKANQIPQKLRIFIFNLIKLILIFGETYIYMILLQRNIWRKMGSIFIFLNGNGTFNLLLWNSHQNIQNIFYPIIKKMHGSWITNNNIIIIQLIKKKKGIEEGIYFDTYECGHTFYLVAIETVTITFIPKTQHFFFICRTVVNSLFKITN